MRNAPSRDRQCWPPAQAAVRGVHSRGSNVRPARSTRRSSQPMHLQRAECPPCMTGGSTMRKSLASGLLTILAALVVAAPATADDSTDAPDFTGETVTTQSTADTRQTCQDPEVAPLLTSFKDDSLYFVAPGGDFEAGAQGWQLDGGAQVGNGSSALAPLGAGNSSLRLPAGSAATSPAFCVDERYPKFRLTAGQLGTAKGRITVSVVYPGLQKNVRHAGDVDVDAKQPWKLSKALDIQPRYGLKKAGWRLVALRFEVDKSDVGADVRVDDVLVDPKMRG